MILSAIFDQLGTFHWHPRSSSWSTFPGEVEEFQNVAAQSKEIRAVTLARTAQYQQKWFVRSAAEPETHSTRARSVAVASVVSSQLWNS